MPIKKYLNRVDQFDQMVRTKSTGTPEEAAKKLGLSKRAFHDFRQELIEDYEFPIAYCPANKSYLYTKRGKVSNLKFRED